MFRIADQMIAAGINVFAVNTPQPSSSITATLSGCNASAWQQYINDNKTDIVTWKAGILLADAAGNNTMRVKAIRSTLRTIKAMRDATGRQIYLNVLSRLTRFPAETLSKEMENL